MTELLVLLALPHFFSSSSSSPSYPFVTRFIYGPVGACAHGGGANFSADKIASFAFDFRVLVIQVGDDDRNGSTIFMDILDYAFLAGEEEAFDTGNGNSPAK